MKECTGFAYAGWDESGNDEYLRWCLNCHWYRGYTSSKNGDLNCRLDHDNSLASWRNSIRH